MSAPIATTLEEARAAKAAALEVFRRVADVVGVGVTRVGSGYAIKVNLRAAPSSGVHLPELVNGVPVRVEIVGAIAKRDRG